MGMYTEIQTNLILGKHTPPEVLERLRLMVRGEIDRDDVKDAGKESFETLRHELFYCDRWDCLFTMGSAYFDASPNAVLGENPDGTWTLVSVANLKNYDNEIGKFADWVRPFCLPQEGPIVTAEFENDDWGDPFTYYYQDGRVK